MIQVSVIVPVYNTILYLNDCVESVLNQTLSFFELILINDGSTDGSKEQCELLCAIDSRIRLISYENRRGVSYARNRGMEAAKGKYLFFLDSDDMIHPQLLENLYLYAKKTNVDMVITAMHLGEYKSLDDWKVSCASPYISKCKLLSEKEILNNWFSLKERKSIGGKLFLRKAVDALQFDENISYSEDFLFNYLFSHRKPCRILYSDYPGYYYRYREDSACHMMTVEDLLSGLQALKKIRDSEVLSGREENAILVESEFVEIIRKAISEAKENDRKTIAKILVILRAEKNNPLFHKISARKRAKLYLCVYLFPLYKAMRSVYNQIRLSLNKICSVPFRSGGER